MAKPDLLQTPEVSESEKVMQRCLDTYFAENSKVDRKSWIISKSDLERWLNSTKPRASRSNLDDLVVTLRGDFDSNRASMEVSRWLNINLPNSFTL